MKYRGFEYSLVQTIAPRGWRWAFDHLDHEFTDVHPTRHQAILRAHRTIDSLISLQLTLHDCNPAGSRSAR